MNDARFRDEILTRYRARRREVSPGDSGLFVGEAENRSCGDRAVIHVWSDGTRIERAAFDVDGCSICVAAADISCELVEGLDVNHAGTCAYDILQVFRAGPPQELPASLRQLRPELLHALDVLLDLRSYPARTRCASLAFSALANALSHI